MKIAVTYDKETGNIFQHFGKTQFFKVYDIQYGKNISSKWIYKDANEHLDLPTY